MQKGARNKDRINVFMDGEFAFAVYIDTALANRLKIGSELSVEEKERILCEDGEKYALACAMKFLSYRMRTEKELRGKLSGKGISEDCVERAVKKLKEIGYLDDREFAGLYAQELLQKYGQRVAVQKLMQKGVPRGIAEEAAKDAGQEEQIIDGYIVRLKQKHRNEEAGKAKQKIIRALMAKGFEYEEIKRALRRYEEE
ncbi:RecX family transcriptional regulator [Christensenella sp. NSJ-35]|uniref:Regulatory protein RecX n=2 Tax=Christensenella tenuis TaxID=2763033 RepID=A0ABR7EBY0_9FIRM|nr:RecX family transcriptional regulator [Christensenella tenuis]